jgi:hypothetical protein
MKRKTILAVYLAMVVGAASAADPPTLSFFARHDYTGDNSLPPTVADTNGDGIPDLITSEGNIGVLFGNGDGTFRAGPYTDTLFRYAAGFVAADVNGDGKVDVVIAGGPEGVDPPLGIAVSLGNGDGTFQSVVFYQAGNDTGIGNPVVGDFNGDGIPDVVAVGSSGVWLFAGTGGGTFNAGVLVVPLSGGRGAGVAATDFNGDQKLDLVVTLPYSGFSGEGFVVLLGNGNGTFQPPQSFAQPKGPLAVALGKLENGYPGIVLTAGTSYVYLYYGNGAGGFSGPKYANLPGTSGSGGVAIGDVNGDGIPDLVSSGGYIAFGKADGTFTTPLPYPIATVGGVYGVVLADLRNNGLTDIVTDSHTAVSVLLSEGKGLYEDGLWTKLPGGAACGVAADYNGDGKPDVAVNTPTGVAILLGTGIAATPFTTGATMTLADTGCLLTGDMNGDGIPDLLVTTPTALVAYLGNGDGTFTESSSTPVSPGYVVLADFNHDGKLDFATSGGQLALGNGDGTFQSPLPIVSNPPSAGYGNIAVGDINNDGWPDLVCTNSAISSSSLYVLLNDQQGKFNLVPTTFGGESAQAVLANLNGDGNLDLVISYIQGGGAGVYLGNGQGGFTSQTGLPDPIGFLATLMVADLNGDGIPDILDLEGDTLQIYLGIGNATYESPFYIGTGPSPASILTANLHGQAATKGLPDIVAPDYSGGVMVLINTTK